MTLREKGEKVEILSGRFCGKAASGGVRQTRRDLASLASQISTLLHSKPDCLRSALDARLAPIKNVIIACCIATFTLRSKLY